MTIIHLAKQAAGGLFATSAFLARSISNYTVTSPSDLTVFGKPSNKQIAFDGYCSNIEAFISATSLKRKLYCDHTHYPIDASHVVTVPLQLPRTVFNLKVKADDVGEKKMMAAAKGMGLEKREIGKGNVYTIERPTIEFLGKLRPLVPDSCAAVTDYSQYGATIHFYWSMQIVDLFLATNTYSYKPSLLQPEEPKMDDEHPRIHVAYYGKTNWCGGCSNENQEVKARKIEAGWDNRQLVEVDTVQEYDSAVRPFSSVFVAKPSPLPSKTSWGSPSECPNSMGIHFPYFEGMMHSDTAFMRQTIHRLFFRNLGSVGKDPKTAFKEYRANIGPAATTPQGRIMNHILFGIDLALSTQTQLFLLFNKKVYLGFNLLGGYFSIWDGSWKEPCSEEKLQAIMATYRSHDATMAEIMAVLAKTSEVKVIEGFVARTTPLASSQDLAWALGNIDQEGSQEGSLVKLEELVGQCVFGDMYRKMNADNLEAAIDELLKNQAISKRLQIYVPQKRNMWPLFRSPYYVPLASFGARSFSLIDRGGKASDVSPTSAVFKEKLAPGDLPTKVKDALPFYEKPIHECIADWGKVVESGKLRTNFLERAIGSRGFLVRGDSLKDIIGILEKAKDDGKIGTGGTKSDAHISKKQKTGDVEMAENVSLADVF